MQSKTSIRKSRKRRKIVIRIICLFLVFFIAGFGGYKIAASLSSKNVKVLGASVNENKDNNNSHNNIVDKKDVKAQQPPKSEGNTKSESGNNENKEPSKPIISNNDYAVSVEDALKKDGIKTAFLTFDDGPSRDVTPQILNILDKYNIKATFFVLGQMAEENKDILKQEYKSGHAIGNHSYTHDYKKIYSGIDGFKQEFNNTNNALKSVLGDKFSSRLFRFPGGGFEKYKNQYKDFLKENGYVYIDWNALNGDAEGRSFSADRLVNRLKNTAAGQEDLVILMHDAGGKKSTVEALPTIIEYLKAQGYEFKVLK